MGGVAGHLPRKENNNKLKAAHKQIYTGSLYACVCVGVFVCFSVSGAAKKTLQIVFGCHLPWPELVTGPGTETETATGTRGLRLGLWHFYEAFSQLTGFTRS